MPERIQLRRTKGWRKPPGVVVVSRPSRWGNYLTPDNYSVVDRTDWSSRQATVQECVDGYRADIEAGEPWAPSADEIREHLGGRDLACWCALDQPCHADVLLEIANDRTTQ